MNAKPYNSLDLRSKTIYIACRDLPKVTSLILSLLSSNQFSTFELIDDAFPGLHDEMLNTTTIKSTESKNTVYGLKIIKTHSTSYKYPTCTYLYLSTTWNSMDIHNIKPDIIMLGNSYMMHDDYISSQYFSSDFHYDELITKTENHNIFCVIDLAGATNGLYKI